MLFDLEPPKDNSPIEKLNITYMQLYYEEGDLIEFKRLCKRGMMRMYPDDYQNQNISAFIFQLLKQYNAE